MALDDEAFEAALDERFKGTPKRAPEEWGNTAFDRPEQPVVGVSWYAARAYCLWLSAIVGRRFRLPSEAEWVAAARGRDGWRFPWGDEEDELRLNFYKTRLRRTTPIGVFPAGDTATGVADLVGNVFEWTSSLFGESDSPSFGYPYDAEDGREDLDAPATFRRTVRGAPWGGDLAASQSFVRSSFVPQSRTNYCGFRVAVSGRDDRDGS
jgi:formylglycine-generating enzyme required for sulfatase activity